MRTIIGIAGVKTSGKSTVANIIKEITNAKESALADKLKNASCKAFGLSREQLDNQDLKEIEFQKHKMLTRAELIIILNEFNLDESIVDTLWHLEGALLKSPRHIAQFVGTEVLRSLGNPDIHCDNVELSDDGVTIISDMRFENEFDYFERMEDIKFIPLYIARGAAEAQVNAASHISETSVFLFRDKCIKICNNGTIDQLGLNINKALEGKL